MDDMQKKISPREVFLYILMIGTLYAGVGSFLALLFQFINLYIPDVLEYYAGESALSGIRWSVAMLTIIFPVFCAVSWMLNRDIAADQTKLQGRFRKWLLYLTVFLAAIVIIGDLVSLIYNFLEGDLTWRFILKSLSVLLVASAVFGYYLWEIRRISHEMPQYVRYFIAVIAVLVAAAIICGFFAAGSPFEKRMERFDERRVSDLQNIQWNIVNFYQRKGALPLAPNDLRDDISGFVPPADPETGVSYEYRTTDKLSFELCAVFARASSEGAERFAAEPKAYPYADQTLQNWKHESGRHCFARTIDPELYPLLKEIGLPR